MRRAQTRNPACRRRQNRAFRLAVSGQLQWPYAVDAPILYWPRMGTFQWPPTYRSAIATLVERPTRFAMLVHRPDGHGAIAVRDGLLATIKTLPERLRKTLTWDQGTELAQHKQITMATKMAIYFCDPHSPWQRGSNENTNGLLRQYFPKGTDLSTHSPQRLLEVANEFNDRPRKTLGGSTPTQAMQRLLFNPEEPNVATTT